MADFNTAYYITGQNEGTYSNHPDDTGGETVFGVSRNNFPKWAGWHIVDEYKEKYPTGSGPFIAALKEDTVLIDLTREWYKDNWWDVYKLDDIQDQNLANEIFDQAVNMGLGKCTEFIQKAINAFNKNYMFGADLLVDKAVGPSTLSKLQEVGNNPQYTDLLRKALDCQQGAFYIGLGDSKMSYRSFTRGWFRTRIGELK